MCNPIAFALTAVAAATAGSAYVANKGLKAQKSAQQQAVVSAQQADRRAEQANNKANQKSPNVTAALSAAEQAALRGGSSTMITGPGGVNTSDLLLGKQTLLGA